MQTILESLEENKCSLLNSTKQCMLYYQEEYLFRKKIIKQLYNWDYLMNPYDHSTFNKMVNGKQITIQFHVDNLKLLHFNEEVVKQEVEKINNKFRTQTHDLNVTKGDLYDYLGIKLDYSHESYVNITMYNCTV